VHLFLIGKRLNPFYTFEIHYLFYPMKRLIIGLVVLSIISVFALTSCSRLMGGGKVQLAFVTNNKSPFWVIAQAGCIEAQKKLGDVEVDFYMPSSGMASEQREILESLAKSGVDGIAVSPINPSSEIGFLNSIAARTLLVCHDSDAPDSDRVCYIGTDNVAAGETAGKLLLEALPEGGKVMVFVGSMNAQNAMERFKGLKRVLAGSEVEILDVRIDHADRDIAFKNAEATLQEYPDLAGVVGLWSYNGLALLHAVTEAGKLEQVKIVCFDEESEVLAGVASGAIYGTVVQQPFEIGEQVVTRMRNYLKGDTEALTGGNLYVPVLAIKRQNVSEFEAKLKSILDK